MTVASPSLDHSHASSEPNAYPRLWNWTLIALAVVTLSFAMHVDADPDLWGHLLFGLDHLQSGSLTRSEVYSYTALGNPWTNHEWLSEWLLGLSYAWGGTLGLLFFRGLLLALCVLAIGHIAARYRANPLALLAWGIFFVPVLAEFYRLRPQMFTYTCMAVLLLMCDKLRARCDNLRAQTAIWLWCVPALMLLWTNLHAGFVAGLGIFSVHLAAHAWQFRLDPHRRRAWGQMALVFTAVMLATCVNPYGPGYWGFVLHAIRLPRPQITEWAPIFSQNWIVLSCYLTAVIAPILVWNCARPRRVEADDVVFLLGVVLAGRHARHLPFLLLFATVVLLRRLPDLLRVMDELIGRWIPFGTTRLQLVHGLWCLTVAGSLTNFTAQGLSRLQETIETGPVSLSTESYPVQAVAFLKQWHVQGNLDCGFNWGEYCLSHLFPACRVFCDGRYETCYPMEISQLVLDSGRDPDSWRRRKDDFGTNLVLLPLDDPFGHWLANQDGFVQVYQDATARLLMREDHPALSQLRAAALTSPSEESENERTWPVRVAFPG